MLDLLKEFLNNPLAQFRIEEQELLLKAILLKVPYILGILPTSSGKSLTYLLTCSLNISKITIVIVPLVGLKNDLIKRAKEFNIPCLIYEDNYKFNNLTLILIESIITSNFIFDLLKLINEDKIDRIIFDECHLLITAASYRPIMYKFHEILKYPIQFVFLTSTLPINLENNIKSNLFLSNLTTIRANCSRDNIFYQAIEYINNSEDNKVKQIFDFIQTSKLKFKSKFDKILIFCPSKIQVDLVSNKLNCLKFYSNLIEEEKNTILLNFRTKFDDFNSILVSTSALEEGFDYSSIRLVIYKDFSYSFIGFLQGSSRGGRDLIQSSSVFFYSKRDIIKKANIELDKSLVYDYLNELVCRRRIIDSYLNNTFINNCSNSQVLCDLCQTRLDITNSQISKVNSFTILIKEKRTNLINFIKLINNSCIFCLAFNSEYIEIKHSSSNCIEFPLYDKSSFELVKEFLKPNFIKLQNDSCCFKCFFPTIICSSIKVNNKCLNKKTLVRFFNIIWLERIKLNTISKLNLEASISRTNFYKQCFNKEFNRDFNTEVIQGVNWFLLFFEKQINI